MIPEVNPKVMKYLFILTVIGVMMKCFIGAL